jgi:hypothetical protein
VRERIVEAVKLDLVGPWPGHALAEERLPGWVRPSNWYLTGFLIPTGTPPDKSADIDEDDDLDEIPESAGLAEESNEERKAAKKGFFPSSMGLSFLVPIGLSTLTTTVYWGDYVQGEIEDPEGKLISVWQRQPLGETVAIALTGASEPRVQDVPGSVGLQLHVVERLISGNPLGLDLPREPPRSGHARGRRAGHRLRLPTRARSAERRRLRAAARSSGLAGRRMGRAGC